ncbi:protein kinase [Streptomyces canus]|uniref:serine/threonine-protein kinase n=1 Tax=Streptomyces canus TaxID=58343 RepID=UPI0036E2C56B
MARAQVIDERYQVLRTLGAGGMGEVFEAVDEALERRVAIKVIRSAYVGPDLQVRFTREARVLARIAHPNIVAVHDIGTQGDAPYLVMELLEGVDLRHLLAERGPLAADVVRAIAAGMCSGLAAAHTAGVLHRDVKPSNVHLTRAGRVVLQDFGIAHLLDSAETTALTRTGVMVGTPGYMPPEALTGGSVGPPSDIYALGVCMYEMLTGRQPFAADQIHAVMFRIVSGTAEPLSEVPAVPADLADLVHRLMSKDPSDRPGPALTLAELKCPANAEQLIAEVVTGDLRDRAVEGFRTAGAQAAPGPADDETDTGTAVRIVADVQGPSAEPLSRVGTPSVSTTSVALSAATRSSILRAMSPEAAEARQREAVQLVLRGSLQEAVELLSGLAEVWRSMFGPDHPSTVTCEYWQGVCLARLGAGSEAVAKFSSVASSSRRTLIQQKLARLE